MKTWFTNNCQSSPFNSIYFSTEYTLKQNKRCGIADFTRLTLFTVLRSKVYYTLYLNIHSTICTLYPVLSILYTMYSHLYTLYFISIFYTVTLSLILSKVSKVTKVSKLSILYTVTLYYSANVSKVSKLYIPYPVTASYTVKSVKTFKSVKSDTLYCYSLLYCQKCQTCQNCIYYKYCHSLLYCQNCQKCLYYILSLSLILSNVSKVSRLPILYTVTLYYTVKTVKAVYTLRCRSLSYSVKSVKSVKCTNWNTTNNSDILFPFDYKIYNLSYFNYLW